MKYLFSLIALVICNNTLFAQQDALYTQHQFNKLVVNAAYAGAREATSITMLYRDQWTQIDGAPSTATFSIHSPLKDNRVALGLTIVNDKLGLSSTTGIMGNYAYRVPFGNGKLSIGVNGGVSFYNIGLSSADPTDVGDPNLNQNYTKLLPNVGVGGYYYTKDWYFGASIPHIINNKLGQSGTSSIARQVRHYTAMGGYVFKINELIKFRPSFLMRTAEGSPMQVDVNASVLLDDRLWVGTTYRSKGSIDFNLEVNVTPQMRLGYAYDYSLSEIGQVTRSSHELLLGFDFQFKESRVVTPRNMVARYF